MVRILVLMLSLTLTSTAFAQNKKGEDRGSDKLQLDKLEQKYWAPKDDNFKVVQNRTYSKEGRFSGSLLYGILTNDTFSEGDLFGGTANYYFSEYWGVELSYLQGNLAPASDLERIGRLGTLPDHSILSSSTTLSAIWVPFYAKMSVMDNTIIYFDMALGLGLGQSGYDIQTENGGVAGSSNHVSFDVTQHFYLNKNFALRFDVKYQIFGQERLRYSLNSGETEADRGLPSMNYQNMMLLLGASFFY